jgi:starch phosphorylase
MPEALEKWNVPLFEAVLPRHLQIIYEINANFMEEIKKHHGENMDLMSKLSIIEESSPKKIRMSHLAVIMSHKVNGVAAIHSNILKESLFKVSSLYFLTHT